VDSQSAPHDACTTHHQLVIIIPNITKTFFVAVINCSLPTGVLTDRQTDIQTDRYRQTDRQTD